MKEMEQAYFTEENYEPDWWCALDIDIRKRQFTYENFMKQSLKQAVGYCDADHIGYRPKSNSYAVMFDCSGRRFWFHIGKVQLDMMLECK